MAAILLLVTVAVSCGDDSDSTFLGPGQNGDDDSPLGPDATTGDDPSATAGGDDTTADDDPSAGAAGVDRSAELVGRWDIVNYVMESGGLTNVLGEDVHVSFAADGTVSYFTGCNQGGSTYTTSGGYLVPDSALDDTPEGQSIVIGPAFEQTEIGCEGFLGEQDVDIPARLIEATRFRIDGDQMLLLDEFLLVEAVRAS